MRLATLTSVVLLLSGGFAIAQGTNTMTSGRPSAVLNDDQCQAVWKMASPNGATISQDQAVPYIVNFSMVDGDGDGKITAEEFKAGAKGYGEVDPALKLISAKEMAAQGYPGQPYMAHSAPLSAWPFCLEPRNPCLLVPSRRVLCSLNRLNGATSRARCVCILVANRRLFEPECKTPRQMQFANGLCRYIELALWFCTEAHDFHVLKLVSTCGPGRRDRCQPRGIFRTRCGHGISGVWPDDPQPI